MGSVKDLIMDDSLAGQLYIEPKPHIFGQGAWRVSGRFSVGDLKELIPPVEIEDKNFALAMTAGRYWEHAEGAGMDGCYLGMIDGNGEIVDTTTLLDRGESSDIIFMRLANSPQGHSEEAVQAYHRAIADGSITVYVADVESIFRAGFPLGSSSFKNIFQDAGRGEDYEGLSTYDETVKALDEIREDIDAIGIEEFPELKDYLSSLNLPKVPNPGHILDEPVYDFTTKFSAAGDLPLTEEEAIRRIGPDWIGVLQRCTADQIEYCQQRGIVNMDGKLEGVVANRRSVLTDFGCTVDENRLMLEYENNGIVYLIPTNKEIQRAIFRARGVYAAIDNAKAKYGDDWRNHVFEFTSQRALEDAAHESCEMMADAIKLVGNLTLERAVFDAKPVEEWVGPFLPYASRLQESA